MNVSVLSRIFLFFLVSFSSVLQIDFLRYIINAIILVRGINLHNIDIRAFTSTSQLVNYKEDCIISKF